ncbi:VWA domain-containing protein, partial [Propionibacterium freudenreichii]|nr:VWA domain-containing protein [Propionibacterium freudenreichii]MCT3012260.1 VWA domain-containing protein [Propionibacterium freudenreichii]
IDVGLEALKQAPAGDDGKQAPGLMVLLSDGSETGGGDPVASADKAKQQNVPIYTIAFGTQNGYVDLDGQRFNVAPDTDMLKRIADASSGKALDAASASQLDDVYKTLTSDVGYETAHTEVTAQWALYSLAFGVVAALGAVSMATRWP